LRILLNLEALNDQKVHDINDYRKVQGFVYDRLINPTSFRNIHDLKTYKLFCFSNLFPPSIVKSGELRYLLFCSPNNHMVNSILSYIKQNLKSIEAVNIGQQQYLLKSAQLLEIKISNRKCVIRSSTPISVRIPE
jgi:CRISPR/Cas system endoribonuclease Cas6 (RAMP superfamily)